MSFLSSLFGTKKPADPLAALAASFPKSNSISSAPIVSSTQASAPKAAGSNPYGLASIAGLNGTSSSTPSLNVNAPVIRQTPGAVAPQAATSNPFDLSGYSLDKGGLYKTPAVQPQIKTTTQTTPQVPYAPVQMPPVNTSNNFSINTDNATSAHMAGNYSPATVSTYRDTLQKNFEAYHASQQPLQSLYASTVPFSQDELTARQNVVDLNIGLAQGLEAMRGQGLGTPLSIVRGNQEKLQNQTALRQSAASATLNNLEGIRTNKLAAIQSQIGFNKDNYDAQTSAATTAQNNQLAQQGTNQSRYDYQQITDPNTGFPIIQVIDKQTGLPAGSISPNSTAGQAIIQSQAQQQYQASGMANLHPVVQSTLQMIGAKQDMPVAQAIQTLGLPAIIQGLVGQEGGSPQGVQNNPGNIKFVGLPGQVNSGVQATDGGTFASYANPQAGLQAVGQLVQNAAQRGSNLSDFIASYKGVQNPTQQQGSQYSNLPPILQPYITEGPNGSAYIREDKVSSSQINGVKIMAARNGIPVLSTDEVDKVHSIDITQQNLEQLQGITTKILSSGIAGRVQGLTTNKIKSYLQTDSDISSFNSFRDTAINTIQALAGGSGSGLRLNAGEIETAVGNLPTINDNLETANRKIQLVRGFLDKWTAEILPNSQGGGDSQNSDPLGLGI